MKFNEFDTVVLGREIPAQGLRKGDLGEVVQVYESDALEVEFVTASGRTQALVSLNASDVREVRDEDLVSVRAVAPTDHPAMANADAIDVRRNDESGRVGRVTSEGLKA